MIRGGGKSSFSTLPIFKNNIFRPLLKLDSEDINSYFVSNPNIKFFDDESNLSAKFLRNRIRKDISPALISEGLDLKKMVSNFHEEEYLDFESRSKAEIIKIDSSIFPLLTKSKLKEIIDFHLSILGMHPINRNLLLDIFSKLEKPDLVNFENAECYFWKSSNSSFYIISKKSAVLKKYSHSGNILFWNKKEFVLSERESVASFQAGMKVYINTVHKEVSELFRERLIPTVIRNFIPIIMEDNKVRKILFELFDPNIKSIVSDK